MSKKLLLLYIALLVFITPVFAYTDQTTTERVIRENKMFIEFLNVCMSNFAQSDSEKKDQFFAVYQTHFNAEVSFLQADYKRSFKNVFKSQDENVKLYNTVLNEFYLDQSKQLLDKLAPSIIKSKNSTARQYLTLGYRDRSLARNIQTVGHASRPHLRSHKIYNYVEAIKYARRSMRYALLSLFESQDVETKKYIYAHLMEGEREANNPFYNRYLDKDDTGIVQEINREYEDYEKEYGPKLESDLKKYEDSGEIPDLTAGKSDLEAAPAADSDPAAGGDPKVVKQKNVEVDPNDPRAQYLYEKKIERRLRFRREKRVAQYIRNGDFYQANDIIIGYVEDFNFKLIRATIEVMQAKEEENQIGVDYDTLLLHHTDNYARFAKDSILDTFADKVKVVDDITDPQAAAKTAEQPEGETGGEGQQTPAEETPGGGTN